MTRSENIERCYPRIVEMLKAAESILVLGPRATGKTYFLKRLIQQFSRHRTIDLLNSAEFERYLSSPQRLYDEVEKYLSDKKVTADDPLYLLIDEVQRLPGLLNEVHRSIEDFKHRIVFVLTGSSARKLRRDKQSNLLAGRAVTFEFFPFSKNEVDINQHLEQVLTYGLLPEIFTHKSISIKKAKLAAYIGTYLSEEIQRESELRNIAGFHRFLEFAANLNGAQVNYSKLARAIQVSPPTVKEYFSILKDTLIAHEVPAWTHSVKKQLQQAPKFYFFDNGVLNAIQGELQGLAKPSTYRYGKLFENLIVTEFIKKIANEDLPLRLYNYRTQSDQEIDLVVQKNSLSCPVAVEIKSETSPQEKDLSALINFVTDHAKQKPYAVVLCRTPRAYRLGSVEVLPFVEGIDYVLTKAMGA